MIYRICTILAFVLLGNLLYGQECIHRDLSHSFDIKSNIQRIKVPNSMDSCILTLVILNKNTTIPIQKIEITSNWLFDGCFLDCNSVRSFTTKKNIDTEAVDNDYGDIVVADFNFDAKDDIAIKNSSGGNGGPEYNFYIQNSNGKFKLETFLTTKMRFFPIEIDEKLKALTTNVHANTYQYSSNTFSFNAKLNTWKMTKSTIHDANE